MTFLLIKSLMRAPVNNGNIAHSSFGINGRSHTDSVDKNNSESPYRYFYKMSYHKDHSAILLLFTFEADAFT